MHELLEQYQQLNEEQRADIFTAEQRKTIEAQISFNKLFTDSAFYAAVMEAVAEELYTAWQE